MVFSSLCFRRLQERSRLRNVKLSRCQKQWGRQEQELTGCLSFSSDSQSPLRAGQAGLTVRLQDLLKLSPVVDDYPQFCTEP